MAHKVKTEECLFKCYRCDKANLFMHVVGDYILCAKCLVFIVKKYMKSK